jgi:type II secretory pathway pseudopilin PulG
MHSKKNKKSFTLIEVVVVIGIMGVIVGGLMTAMKEIIDSELLLKKMQQVEGESRFIMDLFSQDAQYSDIDPLYKPGSGANKISSYQIKFIIADKKSAVGSGSTDSYALYNSNGSGSDYYLKRELKNVASTFATVLNNVPLAEQPVFIVQKASTPEEAENFITTISLLFKVQTKNNTLYVPIQTSVVSRTFEF